MLPSVIIFFLIPWIDVLSINFIVAVFGYWLSMAVNYEWNLYRRYRNFIAMIASAIDPRFYRSIWLLVAISFPIDSIIDFSQVHQYLFRRIIRYDQHFFCCLSTGSKSASCHKEQEYRP